MSALIESAIGIAVLFVAAGIHVLIAYGTLLGWLPY